MRKVKQKVKQNIKGSYLLRMTPESNWWRRGRVETPLSLIILINSYNILHTLN